jgi:hypothetical protein
MQNLFSILSILLFFNPIEIIAKKCTGSSNCTACTNCSRCKYCSNGGSCGVCEGNNNSKKIHKSNNNSRTDYYNNFESHKNVKEIIKTKKSSKEPINTNESKISENKHEPEIVPVLNNQKEESEINGWKWMFFLLLTYNIYKWYSRKN